MEIDDLNFQRFLNDAKTPVMLVFKASFCGPTAMLEPMIEDVTRDFDGQVVVADIDVEKCPNITRKFLVKQTPTLIIFNGTEPVATRMGTTSLEELTAWVEKYIPK